MVIDYLYVDRCLAPYSIANFSQQTLLSFRRGLLIILYVHTRTIFPAYTSILRRKKVSQTFKLRSMILIVG